MKKSALIYIILAGVLWGTSGLFVQFLSPMGLSSLQLTSVRGGVAAICMSVYVFFYNKSLFRATFRQLGFYACSGLVMYLTSAAYYSSIRASSVSTAVVLMYTAPIMVMAYSVAFLGEKLTLKKYICVACMVIGCALVSGIVGGAKFNFWGIVFGLAAGVAYSTYNIVAKMQMLRGYNPITASMYCFVFMMFFSLFSIDPVEIFAVASTNAPESLLLMLGCGVCTSVLPYFLYTVALRDLPAGTASSLSIIEPLSATILSVCVLGEVLNVYSIIGIILIIGAVAMLGKSEIDEENTDNA